MRVLVEFEVLEGQHEAVLFGIAPGAAQDGPDARDDLLEAERLRDVVVAADGQALDLVVDGVAGRDEHDGQLAALFPQAAGDGEPVHVGEHDVEDAQVGVVGISHAQRLGAAGRGGDVEPGVAQRRREQFADVGLVLDDEQAGLGRRSAGHGVSLARDPVSSLDIG